MDSKYPSIGLLSILANMFVAEEMVTSCHLHCIYQMDVGFIFCRLKAHKGQHI